jgi:hypothetical protein
MPIDESEDAMNRLDEQSDGAVWPPGTRPAAMASDNERPTGQLALSMLSMVFAGAVGTSLLVTASSGLFCSMIARPSGANIATGGKIVLLGGIAGILASIVVKNRARLLSAVLLGEAATLGVAIGFVARDSATATKTEDCGFLFDHNVSTSTHHLEYAYALLGLAIIVLLAQALRGLSRSSRRVGGALAGVMSAALLAALLPGHGSSKYPRRTSSGPPKGVLVCRAFPAPEALGGPQCDHYIDIGRAPIVRPEGLECSSYLSDVKRKTIGIQVFYEGELIKHANLRSSDSTTSPYAYFDSSDIDGLATGPRLPIGRYRCRFQVNGRTVRDRTFTVGRVPFATAPLHHRYRLALKTRGRPRRAGPTRLGEAFTVVISSRDLPMNRAVRLQLCVNRTQGEACETYYLTGAKPTDVYWEVDRGEGAGNLYRLSVRVRRREVAHRDLRLVRVGRSSRSRS